MGSKSLLVYVPGSPFSPSVFLPKRELARAASALVPGEHTTTILDFGTTPSLHRFRPLRRAMLPFDRAENSESYFRATLASLQLILHNRLFDNELAAQQRAAIESAVHDIRSHGTVDFIGFYVRDCDDLFVAVQVAKHLKRNNLRSRYAVWGVTRDILEAELQRRKTPFDVAFEASGTPVTMWADRIRHAATWSSIPGVLTRTPGVAWQPSLAGLAHPGPSDPHCYEDSTYPAMAGENKFKLFSVVAHEDVAPIAHDDGRPIAVARAVALSESLRSMEESFGARVFHIDVSRNGRMAIPAFSRCLLERTSEIVFAWRSATGTCDEAAAVSLLTCGCDVFSMGVKSGSQRLLDRHFETGSTVSQIESEIRQLKANGAFTVAVLEYPTLEDDYHTTCETIRLLGRAKPDASVVSIPESLHRGYGIWPTGLTAAYLHGRIGAQGLPDADARGRMGIWSGSALDPRHANRHQLSLQKELERHGILTNLSEEFILIARLSGYAGREGEYAFLLHECLVTGDAEGLADLARAFNRAAQGLASPSLFRPYEARKAVGN